MWRANGKAGGFGRGVRRSRFCGQRIPWLFLAAFRPDGTGDIEERSTWFGRLIEYPDIASPLLSGDRLYFFKAKLGILSCFDAVTGDPHHTSVRVPGLNGMIYSSPIAANGNVYLTDRNGTTVVIRDTEKFEVVSVNRVGETVDATAPVDRELFVRGENTYSVFVGFSEVSIFRADDFTGTGRTFNRFLA